MNHFSHNAPLQPMYLNGRRVQYVEVILTTHPEHPQPDTYPHLQLQTHSQARHPCLALLQHHPFADWSVSMGSRVRKSADPQHSQMGVRSWKYCSDPLRKWWRPQIKQNAAFNLTE